jgi:hypothetical protein
MRTGSRPSGSITASVNASIVGGAYAIARDAVGAIVAAGQPWTIRAAEGRHSQLPWNLSGEAAYRIALPGRRPSGRADAPPVGGALITREVSTARCEPLLCSDG